jgi:MFS family permease
VVIGLFGRNPHELGKALGIWGAAAAAGGTAGVFLGGAITEWLSWRWVFLMNVPLGLGVLAFTPKLLRRGEVSRGGVDWPGALSITGA